MNAITEMTMDFEAYGHAVNLSVDARTLHGLGESIRNDDSLTSDEKDELLGLINKQFGRLNASAVVNRKPRWP